MHLQTILQTFNKHGCLQLHSETLKVFHCFPRLALELRRKIWNAYLDQQPGRIIEIKGNLKDTELECIDDEFRATKASSKAPPSLRICREARIEALRKYQLWNFNKFPENDTYTRLTYFDPSNDIVYFGRKSCLATLANFINVLVGRKEQLSRVAIHCRGQLPCMARPGPTPTTCTHMHNSIYATHGQHGLSSLSYRLHLLNGVQINEAPNLLNGWPGLQEVFICTTHYYPHVDENITFRPPKYSGPFDEQLDMKDFETIQLIRRGVSRCTNWTVGNQPTFRFVSLSKHTKPGQKYDFIKLHSRRNSYIGTQLSIWKSLKKEIEILSNSQCRIKVRACEHQLYHNIFEVEMYGTKEGIFTAIQACL